MARGDVVSDIVALAASANQDVQPASGVEWVIKSFASNANTTSYIRYTDGTSTVWAAQASAVATGAGPPGEVMCIFTNANYMNIRNAHSGGAVPIAYAGYVTKD
jgi:hypothetical protein